ncbi:hypothetical protein PYCCODRAFT_1423837 [Trametes coccinea BRFM310]|uniref:Protein kinase domain-containing protein n=1 Tax=Trametes coccinea (strain BRFM310) TaxID=1353009 RepID=A0A1Y2IUS0_TRAC3|nr:hypothetical protein PYCCODRAFT_1423837 [Trametes coccinea BRFM310]
MTHRICLLLLYDNRYQDVSAANPGQASLRYLTAVKCMKRVAVIDKTVRAETRSRLGKQEFDGIPTDSEMRIRVYASAEPLDLPVLPRSVLEQHYAHITEAYLNIKATELLDDDQLVELGNPGCLVAVLSFMLPERRLPPSVHEGVQSDAQISRENIASRVQSRKSSSESAAAKTRVKDQVISRPDAIFDFRPATLAPPPITVYHLAFSSFLQYLDDDTELSHDDLDTAYAFTVRALRCYAKEELRQNNLVQVNAVRPGLFQSSALNFDSGTIRPDGVIFSKGELTSNEGVDFHPVIAITEIKNDFGEGSCDPLAQAECAYAAIYSSKEARPIREACCCPAFLLAMSGPVLAVSGAIFGDELIAHRLAGVNLIPEHGKDGRSALDDTVHRAARLLCALKRAIDDLDRYYTDKILPSVSARMTPQPSTRSRTSSRIVRASTHSTRQPTLQPAPSFIGPHFTKYTNHADEEVVLTYLKRLGVDELVHNKTVFLAKAEARSETATVVVKFAYKYCEEAHAMLANASPPMAPKLRYCKYEPSVQMYVVIMDYVEGLEAQTKLSRPSHTSSLRTAIQALHGRGFVYGDLREPNVLIVEDEIRLIDFDWAGVEGVARYPSTIYLDRKEIEWHSGVVRGGLVKKEHDEHFFTALTGESL